MVTRSFWRLRSSCRRSTWLEFLDSFSCMWANRKRKPPTASQSLEGFDSIKHLFPRDLWSYSIKYIQSHFITML
jgi:hypothetical protein